MTRFLGWLLFFSMVVLIAVVAVGRAFDYEGQDRVIFTREGVTFDCERTYVPAGEPIRYEDGSTVVARPGGEITYGNCHTIP